MPKKTDNIPSYAALGRLLGTSRQAAWQLAQSADWRHGPPPWPASETAAILRTVAERRDGNGFGENLPPLPAASAGYRPGDFLNPNCPLYLGDWIGDDLDRLPPAALAALAEVINTMLDAGDFDVNAWSDAAIRIMAPALGYSLPAELQ